MMVEILKSGKYEAWISENRWQIDVKSKETFHHWANCFNCGVVTMWQFCRIVEEAK